MLECRCPGEGKWVTVTTLSGRSTAAHMKYVVLFKRLACLWFVYQSSKDIDQSKRDCNPEQDD